MSKAPATTKSHFIRKIIEDDIQTGKHQGKVLTRFPPEPNGFLHIGHCKAICINFGLAKDYNGACNLRFDDTNPEKESVVYINAIQEDIRWLGWQWQGKVHYASDYFEQIYAYAVQLIKQGDAYVCSLTADQAREYRGTLTEAGKNSPYRSRSVEENLQLFADMKAGKFNDGAHVLRAKIDMASPNINMRDPIIYRIRKVVHHQTGSIWCIYPMYDFTHCISDALEGITHSLCSLEFEDHRPLYEWFLEKLNTAARPRQIEFSRLELENTITSKRKLLQLIEEKYVSGWDDPRMPTISGMRRRGYPASALREFVERAGVSKSENSMEMSALEVCIREDLENSAKRTMGVLNPLKVVIENYPADKKEKLNARNHPKEESMGTREIFMTREIFIDQSDFLETASNKFKRLVLDGEVRLRSSYIIKCTQAIKNAQGELIELRCSYDANTLGKNPEDRKVKGVIHWVSATESLPVEVRLYDRLFTEAKPDRNKEGKSYQDFVNPGSLTVLQNCRVEKNMLYASSEDRFQFEREGYFCLDAKDSSKENPVFNRIVTLRDTWDKTETE